MDNLHKLKICNKLSAGQQNFTVCTDLFCDYWQSIVYKKYFRLWPI